MSRWTVRMHAGHPPVVQNTLYVYTHTHTHTHTLTSVKKSQRWQDRKSCPGKTKELRLFVVFFFPVSWAPALGETGLVSPSGRACREKVAQEALRPLETAETGRWRGGGQNRKHQPGGSFRSSPVSLGWTCGTGSHPGAVTGQGAPETLWFWLSEGNKRNGEGWLCLLVWGPWAVPPLAGLQSRQWGSQAPFQG